MALSFSVSCTAKTPLWDHGWFDLTRFRVEGPSPERQNSSQILREFLRDPISLRSFCSAGPWGEPVQRHGPFPREQLSGDWFRPIGHEELAKRVQAALDDPDFTKPPSREQRMAVEAWVEEVEARGDAAFALCAADRADARVDWHFVWIVYHEFACLSPGRDELTIGVIGYD
jgi:hypothetical protein